MTDMQATNGLSEITSNLRKLEDEFVRCSILNSFSQSDVFAGSRSKALRLIKAERKKLAQLRGQNGQ